MRRLLPALLVLALVLPASSQAFTIETVGSAVSKIGPFRPHKDARLQAAVDAFGTPSDVRPHGGGVGCVVEWLNYGLTIRFANFGGFEGDETACSPGVGLAQNFSVRSRRFRTWAGLRPGDLEARIPKLHPAERHGRWWWLQRGERHTGDGRLLPVLKARVRDGRVDRIDGWIGAAGD